MKLKQSEVRAILIRKGIPCFAPGWTFMDANMHTITLSNVRKQCDAWLDTLPKELVRYRRLGGGKTIRVPVHTMSGKAKGGNFEAGDCDNHGFGFTAHVATGNWLKAVREGTPRGGLACGPMIYQAKPDRRNGMRNGGHLAWWFINGRKEFMFWEPGSSDLGFITPGELGTATWGTAV